MEVLISQLMAGLHVSPRSGFSTDSQSLQDLISVVKPEEMAVLRQTVLQKQPLLKPFDEQELLRSFVDSSRKESAQLGASEDQEAISSVFSGQLMLPVNVTSIEDLPADLDRNWLCIPCPEGTRCLLLAAHNTTFAYDMEGSLLCEHDTHLPGGSSAQVSQVADPSVCTVLDCLYNVEQQIYYIMDVMCWSGESLYTRDAQFRYHHMHQNMAQRTSLFKISQTNPFQFHLLTSYPCVALSLARAIGSAPFQMTGLLFYHKDAHYSPGLTPLGCWLEAHLIQTVLPVTLQQSLLYQTQQPSTSTPRSVLWREFKMSRYEFQQSLHCYGGCNNNCTTFCRGDQTKQYSINRNNLAWQNCNTVNSRYYKHGCNEQFDFSRRHGACAVSQKGGTDNAKQQIIVKQIENTPNWDEWDRHDVMMSVVMEKIPERFAEDWIGVICPVAKRRIVVAYNGSTCSYNKMVALDRKFQSRLPCGNINSVQVIKNNDLCILDCLHLKAERTFYVLDVMHWKQMPYYESEADFRFHWIKDKLGEIPLTRVDEQNEYMFKYLPRFSCTQQDILEALRNAPWKVDGLLFFHKTGWYVPGFSPAVLWLTPENVEAVLDLELPENCVFPRKRKPPLKGAPGTDISESTGASQSVPSVICISDDDSQSFPASISKQGDSSRSIPADNIERDPTAANQASQATDSLTSVSEETAENSEPDPAAVSHVSDGGELLPPATNQVSEDPSAITKEKESKD